MKSTADNEAFGKCKSHWRRFGKTWAQLLRDPRWQRKRLEVLQAARWTCEDCNKNEHQASSFEVHHCAYVSGWAPWEYPGDVLMCLCEDCHECRQRIEDDAHFNLGRIMRLHKPKQLVQASGEVVRQLTLTWAEDYAKVFGGAE